MLTKLENFIKHFGVVCIVILFILMTAQVILRYGFDQTFFFTEEVGRYLLIWATLAGMAIEVRRNGHIRVGFLVEKLPPRLKCIWRTFVDIIILILFLTLVYTGINSTLFNHGQESPGLQIPLSIPYSVIPFVFAIAAIFVLEKLLKHKDKSP